MKKLVFFVFVILVSVLGYFVYQNSYQNWPSEKKEAYEFYRLQRVIISNPHLLSKVIVLVQKDDRSFYDTISSSSEVWKINAYPLPHEILIKIPFKEWDVNYGDKQVNRFLIENRIDGLGAKSNYFFICRNNQDIGIHANIVNEFAFGYKGDARTESSTPYNLKHEPRQNDDDPSIVLKKAGKVLKKI